MAEWEELITDIIQSPEAERMLQMVTEGFYDRSWFGLCLFEVIGREYDDMAAWSQSLRDEIFPLSCTWSIANWEFVYGYEPDDSLSLDFRRRRLLEKRREWPPINPARIEAVLSAITGCPVHITDPIRPYTFHVDVIENDKTIYDYYFAYQTLRRIKPSHLSFEWTSLVKGEYTVTDYSAGALGDWIREYIIADTSEIITDVVDYSAGAEFIALREYITSNE